MNEKVMANAFDKLLNLGEYWHVFYGGEHQYDLYIRSNENPFDIAVEMLDDGEDFDPELVSVCRKEDF